MNKIGADECDATFALTLHDIIEKLKEMHPKAAKLKQSI